MSNRLLMTLAIGLAGLPAVWVYDQSKAGDQLGSEAVTVALGPPAPPLMTVRPLAPAAAIRINRAIPFATIPNPPAPPFVFRGSAQTYLRALTCLTAAIYYEAGSEPEEGQRAVAQVVLNRVRHPAYPASVCGVVYQGSTLPTGCQFTFTCDGSLDRQRSARAWARAEQIAAAALAGTVYGPVGHALNYHTNFVVPYWASSLAKKAIVGTHIFYRLPGFWGEERAFRRPYAALEADPVTLRATALAARQRRGNSRPEPAKPLITVEADARAELLGLVDMLAKGAVNADGAPVAKEARTDFSRFSNHLAVEIYRQLAAKDEQLTSRLLAQIIDLPTLSSDAPLTFPPLAVPGRPSATGAGLAEALEAFAKDSDFAAFFARQQSQYGSLKEASFAAAMPIAAEFQNYTGNEAGPIKLIIAPLAQRSFVANCFSPDAASGSLVLVVGEDRVDRQKLASALAHRAVVPNGCGVALRPDCKSRNNRLAIVHDQIARQLAARALDPDRSDDGRRSVKGHGLAVTIGEAFRTFEQNRRWFPTFKDFQPVLLQSVASSERPDRFTPGASAASLKMPVSLRTGTRGADPVCDAMRRGSQA